MTDYPIPQNEKQAIEIARSLQKEIDAQLLSSEIAYRHSKTIIDLTHIPNAHKVKAYSNLAVFYKMCDDTELALQTYQEILELDHIAWESKIDAAHELAKHYISSGNLKKAVEYYSLILKMPVEPNLKPFRDCYITNRAHAYFKFHDQDHAIKDFTAAITLNLPPSYLSPDAFKQSAYYHRARIYHQ